MNYLQILWGSDNVLQNMLGPVCSDIKIFSEVYEKYKFEVKGL